MERKTFDYKLKEKDKELLKLADRASNLEKLKANIRYYTREDKDKADKMDVLNSRIKVYTIEDLEYKYFAYGPKYYAKENAFTFSKALPMEVFTMFRYDSAKFNFSDFIIYGEDPDAGYTKCRIV